jgi:hypothetical protein
MHFFNGLPDTEVSTSTITGNQFLTFSWDNIAITTNFSGHARSNIFSIKNETNGEGCPGNTPANCTIRISCLSELYPPK